ncbi:MAG: invasion associated locus B family protein [Alphaproteobacteria bacterium]|nr:invasion associated locus B family protein [Alphaproteobacteria bacterium]
MTAKRALGLVLALIALWMAPVAALAQDAPAADAPDATAAAPAAAEGNAKPPPPWLKFCGDLADGRKLCLMRQLIYAQDDLIARFILRENPADESPLLVMASMPTGVTLPYGLRLQIDNGRDLILPYIACDSSMCNVRTVVNEAFVSSLKRGAVLKLKAKNARGNDVTIEIDLSGFTSVYNGDEYVSLDQAAAPQQDATDALGQAVQDMAEQIRRQQEAENNGGEAPAEGEQPAGQ